jgi:phenylacetate-CoA ligase
MLRFGSRAEIESAQLESLRALLSTILPANQFYRQKLGDDFCVDSLDDFSARTSFTLKSELVADQQAHPPYGSNLSFDLTAYTRFNQTSGTSGAPMRWLDTNESWSALLDCWNEVFSAANVRLEERIFFAFSFGPFLGFWTAFESATRRGNLCIPGGGLSTEGRLRAIWDNAASVVCCTPTYAIRLGEAAQANGLHGSPVRTIIVAGEPGGSIPGVRARIESLWPGARVFDHHGMTEIGPVTYECPERPGTLHVIESSYFAEVIDAEGARVAESKTGELVLTNLKRAGMPLLRYRTGDLVKAEKGRCVCGRYELSLEGGILGRVDDMVIVRGVNIFPGAVEQVVRNFDEVIEYCVEVDTRGALPELRLQIEALSPRVAVSLEEALRAAFALRIPVETVPDNTLPRFEMKAKRWVRI